MKLTFAVLAFSLSLGHFASASPMGSRDCDRALVNALQNMNSSTDKDVRALQALAADIADYDAQTKAALRDKGEDQRQDEQAQHDTVQSLQSDIQDVIKAVPKDAKIIVKACQIPI